MSVEEVRRVSGVTGEPSTVCGVQRHIHTLGTALKAQSPRIWQG